MTQIAIVIGASQGIEYVLTLNLIENDIKVIVFVRHKAAIKLKCVADVSIWGGYAIAVKTADYSKIDYLINNAAIASPLKSLKNLSQAERRIIFKIILIAPEYSAGECDTG